MHDDSGNILNKVDEIQVSYSHAWKNENTDNLFQMP